MRKDSFAVLLIGLLFINAIVSAVLALGYGFDVHNLRRLQPQTVACQARLNVAQGLLSDTLEYSKRNPSIDPLLQYLNLKTNTAPAPTAPKPAPK